MAKGSRQGFNTTLTANRFALNLNRPKNLVQGHCTPNGICMRWIEPWKDKICSLQVMTD